MGGQHHDTYMENNYLITDPECRNFTEPLIDLKNIHNIENELLIHNKFKELNSGAHTPPPQINECEPNSETISLNDHAKEKDCNNT